MASLTYIVNRDPETGRLAFSGSRLRLPSGLYGYQWRVTDKTGSKHTLSGITESASKRLSSYISEFNRPVDDGSSDLHRYASDPKSTIELELFGPYNEDRDPKELEQELIASVPKKENLNRTSGGNGGGPWSQYGDPTPSVSEFPKDTPAKYYPFKRKRGTIVPDYTPGAKEKLQNGGVYVIRRLEEELDEASEDDKVDCYVGQSDNPFKRARVHASKAGHNPKTKVQRAIAKSPGRFGVGILKSTTVLTPRSRRAAEKHHIREKDASLNDDGGGGGPAPMRKRAKSLRVPDFS